MTPDRDEDEVDTTFRVESASQAPRGYRIVVVSDASTSEHTVAAMGTVTLGRGRESTIRIEDASVSRLHAEIVLGPTLLVRDLGSANGVSVAGKRIPPQALVALGPGEMLQIGNVSVALTPLARPRTVTPVAGTRVSATPDGSPLRDELVSVERQRMIDALDRFAGNQTRAAEALGMPRRTFVKRLGEYGITRPRK